MGGHYSCPARPLETWTAEDLRTGLEHLGFGQYARSLRRAGVPDGQAVARVLQEGTVDIVLAALGVATAHRVWLKASVEALPAAIAVALTAAGEGGGGRNDGLHGNGDDDDDGRDDDDIHHDEEDDEDSVHSPPRRPYLKHIRSYAEDEMLSLSRLVEPYKALVQAEWMLQLRAMGYPQKRKTAAGVGAAAAVRRGFSFAGSSSSSSAMSPMSRWRSWTGSGDSSPLDDEVDDAILDNFRHRDAQLLTEGFFYFIDHSHHRGRLRDSIKEVGRRVRRKGTQRPLMSSACSLLLVFAGVIRRAQLVLVAVLASELF
jgi:hypothetical protein